MIYCVEDDGSIRELVIYTLRNTGFEAYGFADGRAFFEALSKAKPDLVLLDIMLPGEDGIRILTRLRASEQTRRLPVILLTAKSAEYDKVIGLDAGADDYVTKPFGMMELVSRIRAVLRRTAAPGAVTLRVGDIAVHTDRHIVEAGGKEVPLTLKEFELLRCLMENAGFVLTRDTLLEKIWGYDYNGETRTVDVHVRTLRHKLGKAGDAIETVRGVGYRIGGRPQL